MVNREFWNRALNHAVANPPTGKADFDLTDLSYNWRMCAIGEILAPLPRAAPQNLISHAVEVVSPKLYDAGVAFNTAVADGRYIAAIEAKKEITALMTPAVVKEIRAFIKKSIKEVPKLVAAMAALD